MGKLKSFSDTWKELSWIEKFPIYSLMFLVLGMVGVGAAQHINTKAFEDAGFTDVKVKYDNAYVGSPTNFKPCRIALHLGDSLWYLSNPDNDGVPVRKALEVFNRPHVRAYCHNKQPRYP